MARRTLATLLLGLSVAVGAPAAARAATELLPDLYQEPPSDLTVQTVGSGAQREVRLGFRSAVDNIGAGPLLVAGSRADTGTPTMSVTQTVNRDDATTATYGGVGTMRYVAEPDHQHWHYLGFDRYSLSDPRDGKAIAPDHKSGFCIGDRYDATGADTLPGEPPSPVITGYCKLGHPEALSVDEGISVGYGDDYSAQLEGQYVSITDVLPGRYDLIHRVNADGALHELSLDNDVASLDVQIAWPDGPAGDPVVTVRKSCPGTDHCAPVPPPPGPPPQAAPPPALDDALPDPPAPVLGPEGRAQLSHRDALVYVRDAIAIAGSRPGDFHRACTRYATDMFRCLVRWSSGAASYRGEVIVRIVRADAPPRWSWRIIARRRGRGTPPVRFLRWGNSAGAPGAARRGA